jgi:hypothetical protein
MQKCTFLSEANHPTNREQDPVMVWARESNATMQSGVRGPRENGDHQESVPNDILASDARVALDVLPGEAAWRWTKPRPSSVARSSLLQADRQFHLSTLVYLVRGWGVRLRLCDIFQNQLYSCIVYPGTTKLWTKTSSIQFLYPSVRRHALIDCILCIQNVLVYRLQVWSIYAGYVAKWGFMYGIIHKPDHIRLRCIYPLIPMQRFHSRSSRAPLARFEHSRSCSSSVCFWKTCQMHMAFCWA